MCFISSLFNHASFFLLCSFSLMWNLWIINLPFLLFISFLCSVHNSWYCPLQFFPRTCRGAAYHCINRLSLGCSCLDVYFESIFLCACYHNLLVSWFSNILSTLSEPWWDTRQGPQEQRWLKSLPGFCKFSARVASKDSGIIPETCYVGFNYHGMLMLLFWLISDSWFIRWCIWWYK
jgi:hypothetical protein